MAYYELDELETNLTPDPNCCGYEGDCEGCSYWNHHNSYCTYNKESNFFGGK